MKNIQTLLDNAEISYRSKSDLESKIRYLEQFGLIQIKITNNWHEFWFCELTFLDFEDEEDNEGSELVITSDLCKHKTINEALDDCCKKVAKAVKAVR